MAGNKLVGVILDRWAALSHKAPLGETPQDRMDARLGGWEPANWTGEEHRRRLTAYMVLAAYMANSSRHFLQTSNSQDRDERREYGDAALVVEQTVAHLLGETQEVNVPGAEKYDPDLPDTFVDVDPDSGEETERPATDDERQALADNAEAGRLVERQEFLRTWADDVHLPLRLVDSETNAVGLGDSAILLGWDPDTSRVVPSVMEPGFYFPVLPDSLDGYQYPNRVHFAWEVPGEDYPDGKDRVRRITYEVRDLSPRYDEDALARAASEADVEAATILPDGAEWRTASVNPDDPASTTYRYLVRTYPWSTEETTQTCVVTDAEWILADLRDASKPEAFDVSQATIRFTSDGDPLLEYDLGIDFLPVVHIPNTPTGGHHYGESSLAKVLQILDDLQNTDTDSSLASGTTGSPIIVRRGAGGGAASELTGVRASQVEVRPGTVWDVAPEGGVDVVDTSGGLAALGKETERLLDRLSVNARLPAAVLGRVKPSEVPSGFALQLGFGPLSAMIRTMRHVRNVKYALMLKMVQRLYQANGVLPPGPTPRAELALGAYLPTDMAGTLNVVKEARDANLISLETGVRMLLEAGFAIDDVAEEIRLIEGRDFEGADRLVDVTGDANDGLDYLGRERREAQRQAPVIDPNVNQPGGAPVVEE